MRTCTRCSEPFNPDFHRQRLCWSCWRHPPDLPQGGAYLILNDGLHNIHIFRGLQFVDTSPITKGHEQ